MRELSARVVNKWKSKAQKKERGRRYVDGEEIDRGNAIGLLVSCLYGLFQEVKAKN